MKKRITKAMEIGGATLVTEAQWNQELDAKHDRLTEWLREEHLAGVLIRRNENIAWLTGGAVDVNIITPCETGAASLLVTVDGKRYYLTTENEAPRLRDEEFSALDFEPFLFPWYADDTIPAAIRLAGGPVASDMPDPSVKTVSLYPLRAALCEAEMARYRWLGAQSAAATVETIRQIEPGQSEYDIGAMNGANLRRRGILPSVFLYAVDDRIFRYKHAVSRGRVLKNFAMLNLCTRKWGLVVSITRFVYFGSLPAELAACCESAATVNAALLDATKVGATSAELYRVVQDAYAAEGAPGEERLHHQGGATGYSEREWVITPNGTETVVNNQAFGWNPTFRGGKAEDTVILRDGEIEYLTSTPALPVIEASANGHTYPAAGVFVR